LPIVEEGVQTQFKYSIDTELSIGTLKFLPEYLRRQYLLLHEEYRTFFDVQIMHKDGQQALSYKVAGPHPNQYSTILVQTTIPLSIIIELSDPKIPQSFIKHLIEDLFLIVQQFEEEVRKTTLYFAFMPGEKMIPEKEEKNRIVRLFADSMLSFYIALIALNIAVFWIFGSYAPLLFIVFSSALSLLSGKLIARISNWKITKEQPEIQLLQYHLLPNEYEQFRDSHGKIIPEIRKEIYQATIAIDQPINCDTAGTIFSKYGIDCTSEDFSIKKVNLYQLVKKAANRFKLKMPTIVVLNSIIPNAAASGPTLTFGTIMITTGIMTQLEEDELVRIIGHELSHLNAHDQLKMLFLSNAEYILRFYVLLPHLLFHGIFLYSLYSLVAIGVIYFFSKFLEARADLDSVKILGQPKVLAEALKKIAFKRLFPLQKREPAFRGYRRSEWLQLEPHPPLYFRIARLENLRDSVMVQNTFIQSIKDSLTHFLRS
jgi:heat shock protein HtpX